jgi:hypothetical protein
MFFRARKETTGNLEVVQVDSMTALWYWVIFKCVSRTAALGLPHQHG